jgi:group I intron endonuclease
MGIRLDKEIFTLYQYTNRVNGKRYIGVTNNPIRRFAEHAKGRGCARLFNAAVKKYGIEIFDYKVMALFGDVSAAAYHEQAAIRKLGTLAPEGYNLTAGAPCTIYGGSFSAETRAKISAALIGKSVSAETRAKLSAAQKGNKHLLGYVPTAETRVKISAANRGKAPWNKGKKHPYSAETLKKIGMANKKRVVSAETRAKMSSAQKGNKYTLGHKLSVEHKAKIGAAGKGRRHSAETRAKMSQSQQISVAHKVAMASPGVRAKMSASHKKSMP